MSSESTESTATQTEADETTSTQTEEQETYTKDQLTEIVKREVNKVTAKFSKKLDQANVELETERRKSMPDPEKFKAELEDRDKQIAAKSQELSSAQLENVKLRALIKAGADPEKLDALSKRLVGSTPEEIEADVAELKTLGLISAPRTGLGTATTTGSQTKVKTPKERDAEITLLLQDPKLDQIQKMALAREQLSLQNEIMRGSSNG